MNIYIKLAIRILLTGVLFQGVVTQSYANGLADTVVNRYRQYLFRTMLVNPEKVTSWATSLQEDHRWPDLNYGDTERANWQVLKHLERVRDLAFAWSNPRSIHYRNEAVWETLNAGLDHWLVKRYKNSNWWHNEIGVPQHMRDILVLVRHVLTADQVRQSLEVLKQHRVQGNGQGANLIWSADLGLHYGALTNDEAMMERCRTLMVNEVYINTAEGIQPDFSYHQHGDRLQVFQYGKAFLQGNVRIAWQLRGTAIAFSADKINVLADFIFQGWQWMARGIHTVPGTMDRSVSRENELRSPDIREMLPFLRELFPGKVSELQTLSDWQNGTASLKGMRHWPYSDFTAYHREHFSFFVKTISSRTLPSESINNENQKGHLLNSGDAYLIRNGDEYFNLMPGWDWQRLPGSTSFEDARIIGRQPFAGNANNGKSGVTAMDYVLKDKEQKQVLSTHKFWACHDDMIVCLIADLNTSGVRREVLTTLDQCRWQGDVTVNKPGDVLKKGEHSLQQVKWIHHTDFAYIPLGKEEIRLEMKDVTGTWKSINVSQSGRTISEKVFIPMLKHSQPLRNHFTGYVLAYCPDPKDARKLERDPPWQVLRNDKFCQAVAFKDGTMMSAFFLPAHLKGDGFDLEVDKPCLVLIAENKMYVSDPLQKGGTVKVKWKGAGREAQLPQDGSSLEIVY